MKLKPCPFCGKENPDIFKDGMGVAISCREYDGENWIGCYGRMRIEMPGELPDGVEYEDLYEWMANILIEQWNRRKI